MALAAGLAGCPQTPSGTGTPTPLATSPTPRPTATSPEEALAPVDPSKPIALLDDGDVASLRQALAESREYYAHQPPPKTFVFGPRTVTTMDMRAAIDRATQMLVDNPPPAVLSSRMAAAFDLMESTGGDDGGVLFTGYYEPLIAAAKRKGRGYTTPIYGAPNDTIAIKLGDFDEKLEGERLIGRLEGRRLVPYWKRADIDAGRLGRHAKPIAWAKDPVDLFFVQVQGSASLQFPDGSEKRIGYDGSNGYTYKSIGRMLIDEGKIPRELISMQSIRAYLDAHPEEVARLLEHDESYVFFRWLKTAPVGVLGRPVTPGRSIATDTKLFPQGAIAFVDTTQPVPPAAAVVTSAGGYSVAPLRRFVLNQDTGGAIKGAGRVDFFWGKGERAAFAAGLMKQPGRLVFLVPKASPTPTPPPAFAVDGGTQPAPPPE